jgi:hypothetical protein
LDHRLPIAIMTWLRYVADGRERQSHALYPLTVFSAEWQALVAAREFGARAAFIDLPWADQFALTVALAADDAAPRPGEEEAAPSLPQIEPGPGFFETLALRVGREDSSAVWDEFFEIDPDLDPDTYLVRAARWARGCGCRRRTRTNRRPGHVRRSWPAGSPRRSPTRRVRSWW